MLSLDCAKKLGQNFKLNAKLAIKSGEFVAIYGKSGSGKTTILRLIAGFEKPDSGFIKTKNKSFFDGKNFIQAKDRNIGYLFQDYALFPNMNVLENLLFAKKDKNRALELLELVELTELKDAKIFNLSGGQKQRVALARALMRKPEILLLDEPLSALDTQIRKKLQDYLLLIHKKFKMTIVLVSHDIGEIYKLATRVFSIDNGEILRDCSPRELFFNNKFQKFSIHGKILEISKQDSVFVATILASDEISKVILTQKDAQNLRVDDEVVLSAKAFGITVSKI